MTQPHKLCPRCQKPAALTDAYCQGCGRRYQSTNPMGPDLDPVRQQKQRVIQTASFTGVSCLVAIVSGVLFFLLLALMGSGVFSQR